MAADSPSAAPAPGDPSRIEIVDARPIVMSRLGYACAVVVLVVFVATAVVMRHANAGAHFGVKDQMGTALLGVIIGGLFLMLTRPRLHADRSGIRMRSFLGGWRTVPWQVVERVEFPAKVRFARIVLPADETLALYAVQRVDRAQAVDVMRRLRGLLAEARS